MLASITLDSDDISSSPVAVDIFRHLHRLAIFRIVLFYLLNTIFVLFIIIIAIIVSVLQCLMLYVYYCYFEPYHNPSLNTATIFELFDINDIMTLKSGSEVTQGNSKWYHSKAWVRFPIRLP